MRAAFVAAALFLAPLPLHAQEGAPPSGSGAATASGDLLMDRLAALLERVDAPEVRRAVHLGDPGKEAERRADDAKTRDDIAEHRRTCRASVRRANRDARMETVLRCYRGEMTLGLLLLRRERDAAEANAALTTEVREEALDAIDELIDAISAIVDGIDLGVYATEDALIRAKANLRDKYRVPQWRARQRLEADRLRAWLQLLIRRTTDVLADRPQRSEAQENAVACLEQAVEAVFAARNTGEKDLRARAGLLTLARTEARSCADALRPLANPLPEIPAG